MTDVSLKDEGLKYAADLSIGGITGMTLLFANIAAVAPALLGYMAIEKYTRTGAKNADGSDQHYKGEAHGLFAAAGFALACTYGPGGLADQIQETAALETTGSEYVQVVDTKPTTINTKTLSAKIA